MTWFRLVILILIIHISNSAHAEYRVFLLKIAKKATAKPTPPTSAPADAQQPPPDSRLVESTLDHLQYRSYYSVPADENVTYVTSWKCRGRTDEFKAYCPNPKVAAQPSGASPAKDQFPKAANAGP